MDDVPKMKSKKELESVILKSKKYDKLIKLIKREIENCKYEERVTEPYDTKLSSKILEKILRGVGETIE